MDILKATALIALLFICEFGFSQEVRKDDNGYTKYDRSGRPTETVRYRRGGDVEVTKVDVNRRRKSSITYEKQGENSYKEVHRNKNHNIVPKEPEDNRRTYGTDDDY